MLVVARDGDLRVAHPVANEENDVPGPPAVDGVAEFLAAIALPKPHQDPGAPDQPDTRQNTCGDTRFSK